MLTDWATSRFGSYTFNAKEATGSRPRNVLGVAATYQSGSWYKVFATDVCQKQHNQNRTTDKYIGAGCSILLF